MCYRHAICGNDANGCIRHLIDAAYAIIFEQLDRSHDITTAEITERIRNHMIEHFSDPEFSVADAIRSSGVGANKLRQIFRTAVGMTPGEYLRSLRLKNAESLLLYSDISMTVTEIAQRSGFRDPLYFSKVFHEVMGQTPTEYRKNLRNSNMKE